MEDDHDRIARLERMMAELLPLVGRREPRPPVEREERYEDRGLKLEVADFDGTTGNPEVYLEWERCMERYFEYKDTPDEKKYKLAKLKLVRSAAVWFEGLQKQRAREDRGRILSWAKLKKHLRRKYVPPNYKQTLYIRWSSLQQGKKSVQEYMREFEKLAIDCEINEVEEMRMGRFVGGLNEDLRDKLETHSNLGYDDACRLAMTYEKQRKKKGVVHEGSTSYKAPLSNKQGPSHPWPRSPTPHPGKQNEAGSSDDAPPRPRRDPKDMVCYRCNGFGHMKAECPNKKAFTMREWLDLQAQPSKRVMLVDTEDGEEVLCKLDDLGKLRSCNSSEADKSSDEEEEEEREVIHPEQQRNLVIRKNFHASSTTKQHEQRENVFQTKCRVGDNICDLIVDGGSEINCIDKGLVDRMGLSTTKHPAPYRLKWLDEQGGQYVRKQCLVNLGIGSYKDQILCDVLNMDACHILLGRPWQHDRKAVHDGYNNVYTIKDQGKKKDLLPLPPSKTIPPPKVKQANFSTKEENFEAKGGVQVEVENVTRAI